MTFEKALQALKQGFEIGRSSWACSISINKYVVFFLTLNDILADDWEVI